MGVGLGVVVSEGIGEEELEWISSHGGEVARRWSHGRGWGRWPAVDWGRWQLLDGESTSLDWVGVG